MANSGTRNKTANMNITIYNTNKFKAPVDPDNPTDGTENKTSLKSKLPEHNIDFYTSFKKEQLPQNLCFTKELLISTSSHFLDIERL